jgi:hypothetical protein
MRWRLRQQTPFESGRVWHAANREQSGSPRAGRVAEHYGMVRCARTRLVYYGVPLGEWKAAKC